MKELVIRTRILTMKKRGFCMKLKSITEIIKHFLFKIFASFKLFVGTTRKVNPQCSTFNFNFSTFTSMIINKYKGI